MSGIAGLFWRDGHAATEDDLRPLREAMHRWGPDGRFVCADGAAALAKFLARTLPEEGLEEGPARTDDGVTTLVAIARLDNRDDLLNALGVPPAQHGRVSDSALVLRAYERWGEACVDHLLGDWSCAAWNARERRLFVARDPFGNTGLFYHVSPRLFAFASSLSALLALPQVPGRLNVERIARLMLVWPGDGTDTCYADVRRLPPAHHLTVDAERCASTQYWWLENAPDVRPASDEECFETFLNLFTAAVQRRLRRIGPVGGMLSGGLDSGSVCALAARHLAAEGERLLAFSGVPLYALDGLVPRGRLGDEAPLVRAVQRHAGNIDVEWVRAEDVSPLEGIRRSLGVQGEPAHTAGNFYWTLSLFDRVRARECSVLLTGQVGNFVISWTPPERFAGPRDVRQLLRERGAGVALMEGLVKPMLRPARDRLLRGREMITTWRDHVPLSHDLDRRLRLRERLVEETEGGEGRGDDLRTQRANAIGAGRSLVGSGWHSFGGSLCVEARDPTMDIRLMEFCVGLPETQFWRDGEDRRLIRRAMTGYLPDEVRLCRQRGLQAADIVPRLCAETQAIEDLLDRFDRSDAVREFVDTGQLRVMFHGLSEPLAPMLAQVRAASFLRAVGVGMFLLEHAGQV